MHPVTEGGAIHTEGEKEAEQTCPATCTSLQVIPNHEENSSKNPSVLGLHPLSYLMASEKPNGPSNLQNKTGGKRCFSEQHGGIPVKKPTTEVEGPLNCSFFTNLCDAFGWKLLLLVGLAEITLKDSPTKHEGGASVVKGGSLKQ